MKNLVTILFLFFMPTLLIGQNLKALDDKYGFRDAKLETPVSSFKNLKLDTENYRDFPYEKVYNVTNVDLHIGDYTLEDIVYFFYKGQLSTIDIMVSKGYENQQGVLKVLEAAYGKGVYKKRSWGDEVYSWVSQKVSMTYSLGNDINPYGDIQIGSQKLYRLRLAEENLIKQQKEQEILKAAKKL